MKLIALISVFTVSVIAVGKTIPKTKTRTVQKTISKGKDLGPGEQASESNKQKPLSALLKKGWTVARSWLPVVVKVGLVALLLRQEWISQYGPAIQVAFAEKSSPAANIVNDAFQAVVAAGKTHPDGAPLASTVTSQALVAVGQATPLVPRSYGHSTARSYGHSTARSLGKGLLRDVMALTVLSKENDQVSKLSNWAASVYNELLHSLNGAGAGISELMPLKLKELENMKLTGEESIRLKETLLGKYALHATGQQRDESLLKAVKGDKIEKMLNSFSEYMWAKTGPSDQARVDVVSRLSAVIKKVKDESAKFLSQGDRDRATFLHEKYEKILSSVQKKMESVQFETIANAQYPWQKELEKTYQAAQQDIANLGNTRIGQSLQDWSNQVYSGLAQLAESLNLKADKVFVQTTNN